MRARPDYWDDPPPRRPLRPHRKGIGDFDPMKIEPSRYRQHRENFVLTAWVFLFIPFIGGVLLWWLFRRIS